MKTTTIKLLRFFLFLFLGLSLLSCDPDNGDDPVDYKPNIYLYPEEETELTVLLNFPQGGEVITSEPDYGEGWNITVDTNGVIDDTYTYLFYESSQPDVWQRTAGWIVATAELESFFRKNLAAYGFAGQEIEDFIDYWIPRFTAYPQYTIYPQTDEIIDQVIDLSISENPDNILRLHYLVRGGAADNELETPVTDSFSREGFFVTEWGVILD